MKFDVPKRYKIGNTERLVKTPVITQLLYYKSKLFIAWVPNVGYGVFNDNKERKSSLNLTCIDLNEQKNMTFQIKNKIDPNTHLAMNILNGTIMFAYHQESINGKTKSKIVTIFKDIDELLKQKTETLGVYPSSEL